jgi:hypothetical protein
MPEAESPETHSKGFHIKIDRVEYRVGEEELTGAQLRQLPKPPIGPERDLFEIIPGKLIARSLTVMWLRSSTESVCLRPLRTSIPDAPFGPVARSCR